MKAVWSGLCVSGCFLKHFSFFFLQVHPKDLVNGVINAAFLLLFKDLIKLYACYNDGIINLLGKKLKHDESIFNDLKFQIFIYQKSKHQCSYGWSLFIYFLQRNFSRWRKVSAKTLWKSTKSFWLEWPEFQSSSKLQR